MGEPKGKAPMRLKWELSFQQRCQMQGSRFVFYFLVVGLAWTYMPSQLEDSGNGVELLHGSGHVRRLSYGHKILERGEALLRGREGCCSQPRTKMLILFAK